MKQYLYIYPHCHAIKGYSRCVIMDSFRNSYQLAPLQLADMLPVINGLERKDIAEKMGTSQPEQLQEYLDFLVQNEFARWSNTNMPYKDLETYFDYPARITNMIIFGNILGQNLITEINDLQCENVQLYFHECVSVKQLETLLHLFDDSVAQHIEIIISFVEEFISPTIWENIFDKFKRLQKVVVLKAPEDKRIFTDFMHQNSVVFVSESFSYEICGEVHPLHFTCNLPFFTEAQHHNTCLNRKICIDAEGDIKNCPAMSKSYGNIKDTTLEEAINTPGFKDLWYICKDQIDVCKDCEFRYMCTDCRAFIKDPENIYSQPAKCTYNPYICLWEGQEGYVPVEECGTYSCETGFVPDKKRIAELNKRIWGEE